MPIAFEAVKLAGEILNWTAKESERIKRAMGTGAQWEIWLQVELALGLKATASLVVREEKYDSSAKSVDLMCQVVNRAFAIELKTESTKTGLVSNMTMLKALKSDKAKLLGNPLAQKVNQMGCTSLSALAIGIGSTSKFRATALGILDAESMVANIQDDFGVYIMLIDF